MHFHEHEILSLGYFVTFYIFTFEKKEKLVINYIYEGKVWAGGTVA